MSKIAVFFPGIGYHCDKPLLYYSRSIVRGLGYEDIRNLSYTYSAGNIRGDEEKMKAAYEALYSQTEAALGDIAWSDYDDVLFVSKSIGTIIAASYARKKGIPEKYGIKRARHVLYTPLAQTFQFAPKDAIAFIGTSDPWSDVDQVVRLSEASHVPMTLYEGCNHSLECADALKNIEILRDVMQRTVEFCQGTR